MAFIKLQPGYQLPRKHLLEEGVTEKVKRSCADLSIPASYEIHKEVFGLSA